MAGTSADKEPLKSALKFLVKWGTIGVIAAWCGNAIWDKVKDTWLSLYVIALGVGSVVSLVSFRIFRERVVLRYGVPLLSVLVSLAMAHVITTRVINKKQMAEWQPPELPTGCTNVSVRFGSEIFTFPTPLVNKGGMKVADHLYLRLAEISFQIGTQTFNHPVLPEYKDNRFYLSVLLPYHKDRRRISMSNALDGNLPPNWDRNYSSNAFEIVRQDNTPLLQVIYRRADVIDVYGVFVLDLNHVLVTFGPTNSHWLQNLTADNANITVDSTAQILSTTAFEADFTKRTPLFKYPSWKYQGVFAD